MKTQLTTPHFFQYLHICGSRSASTSISFMRSESINIYGCIDSDSHCFDVNPHMPAQDPDSISREIDHLIQQKRAIHPYMTSRAALAQPASEAPSQAFVRQTSAAGWAGLVETRGDIYIYIYIYIYLYIYIYIYIYILFSCIIPFKIRVNQSKTTHHTTDYNPQHHPVSSRPSQAPQGLLHAAIRRKVGRATVRETPPFPPPVAQPRCFSDRSPWCRSHTSL